MEFVKSQEIFESDVIIIICIKFAKELSHSAIMYRTRSFSDTCYKVGTLFSSHFPINCKCIVYLLKYFFCLRGHLSKLHKLLFPYFLFRAFYCFQHFLIYLSLFQCQSIPFLRPIFFPFLQ